MATAKRYFEHSSESKFWEIWHDGGAVYTRFGKIGSNGQTKLKQEGANAKAAVDKQIADKTRKGYAEPKKTASNGAASKRKGGANVDEVPPGTIRLELVEGSSKKFWQIRRDGKALAVTFGRIGAAGQTQHKKLKDEWEAKRQQDKLVDEKKRKGYQLVLANAAPAGPAATNPELEKQILKDPASPDGYMVYADWLQTQGDVRGELAAVQARLVEDPKNKKLGNTEAKLLWDYRAQLWGALAPYVEQKPKPEEAALIGTWRQGWLDTLVVSSTNDWHEVEGVSRVDDVAELVRLLPNVASARFLRELVIARPCSNSEYNFGDAVKELAKALPELPALRRLTIGKFAYEDSELSWSHLGKAESLWAHAGKLEYLKIRAGSMMLGALELPELRELRIETGGLSRKSLAAIAKASWPELETLNLWFGQDDYGGDCEVKDVKPLLDAKRLPRLRHLGLANATFGNELCELVAQTKLVSQLETLDLSMSHITIDGVRTLAANKARFAHLAKLDLSRCLLDKSAQQIAKTLAKHVELGRQEDPEEYQPEEEDDGEVYWMRYSAVGE